MTLNLIIPCCCSSLPFPPYLVATMHMAPPGPGAILALGEKLWLHMSISGSMAAGCTRGGRRHVEAVRRASPACCSKASNPQQIRSLRNAHHANQCCGSSVLASRLSSPAAPAPHLVGPPRAECSRCDHRQRPPQRVCIHIRAIKWVLLATADWPQRLLREAQQPAAPLLDLHRRNAGIATVPLGRCMHAA